MDNSRAFINYDARFDPPDEDYPEEPRQHYCDVWDSECQCYCEIMIDGDGRLYGFPDCSQDGCLASETLIIRGANFTEVSPVKSSRHETDENLFGDLDHL